MIHVGEQWRPKSHVMVEFQQPHSDVPSSCYSINVTRPFGRGLCWEPCWREICLCTLTHTWRAHIHAYTQVAQMPDTHIHTQRGIHVRDQLQGLGMTVRNASRGLWSDTSRCLCRCQPWETLRPRRAPARG